MRSFLSGRRSSRRRESRFGGLVQRAREAPGNRDLIRFRRNRELLAREFLGIVLWVALCAMLLYLAQSMQRVAAAHLAQRDLYLRLSLPLLPLLGAAGALWRAGLAFREWRDIRREQKELVQRLREAETDAATTS